MSGGMGGMGGMLSLRLPRGSTRLGDPPGGLFFHKVRFQRQNPSCLLLRRAPGWGMGHGAWGMEHGEHNRSPDVCPYHAHRP